MIKINKTNLKITMWNPFKKSKEHKNENNKSVILGEEFENLSIKADLEAYKIFTQIYLLFKERINELKEGDNFILFQENRIKICDNEELSKNLVFASLSCNHLRLCERISELSIVYGKEIKAGAYVSLGFEKYYLYTIKISRADVIEIYYIKFIVHPSPKEINNGNEICVTVHAVDKNIYKIL